MAIFDFDGTVSREIGKIFDDDGTSCRQIGKMFDNDGTADKLIYSSELLLPNLGTSWNYSPWTSGSDCAATYYLGSWNVAGFDTVSFNVNSFWRWGGVGGAGVQFKVNGDIFWYPGAESKSTFITHTTTGVSTVTLSVTTWINVSNVSGAAIWGDINATNAIAR